MLTSTSPLSPKRYSMWGKNNFAYDALIRLVAHRNCYNPCQGKPYMPRIITSRHREGEIERARLYMKSRLMLPTIPLAMVTLLTGYGALAMMWFQDTLTAEALLGSTLLFVLGAILGWGHVRYERYLVKASPEYFARKHKLLEAAKAYRRPKRDLPTEGPHHRGRQWAIPMYLVAGMGMLAMSIWLASKVGVYPAFLLPWAGYLNAKVIFWRDLFVA